MGTIPFLPSYGSSSSPALDALLSYYGTPGIYEAEVAYAELEYYYKHGGQGELSDQTKQLSLLGQPKLSPENLQSILNTRSAYVDRVNVQPLYVGPGGIANYQGPEWAGFEIRAEGTSLSETVYSNGSNSHFFLSSGDDYIEFGDGTFNYADLGPGADSALVHQGTSRPLQSINGAGQIIPLTPPPTPRPGETPAAIMRQAFEVEGLPAKIDYVDLGNDFDRDVVTFRADDAITGYGLGEVAVIRNFRPEDVVRLPGSLSSYEVRDIPGVGSEINYILEIQLGFSLGSADVTSSNGVEFKKVTIGIIEGEFLAHQFNNGEGFEGF